MSSVSECRRSRRDRPSAVMFSRMTFSTSEASLAYSLRLHRHGRVPGRVYLHTRLLEESRLFAFHDLVPGLHDRYSDTPVQNKGSGEYCQRCTSSLRPSVPNPMRWVVRRAVSWGSAPMRGLRQAVCWCAVLWWAFWAAFSAADPFSGLSAKRRSDRRRPSAKRAAGPMRHWQWGSAQAAGPHTKRLGENADVLQCLVELYGKQRGAVRRAPTRVTLFILIKSDGVANNCFSTGNRFPCAPWIITLGKIHPLQIG
jgi:hypothetical protein